MLFAIITAPRREILRPHDGYSDEGGGEARSRPQTFGSAECPFYPRKRALHDYFRSVRVQGGHLVIEEYGHAWWRDTDPGNVWAFALE